MTTRARGKPPLWRREPFRVFFPLGILLGWVGIGHWILYWAGILESYSCQGHGLVQMQGFMIAFAAGFLLTMLPRRTQAAPASGWTIASIAFGLVVSSGGNITERWIVAQAGYLTVWVALVSFVVPRLLGHGAGRRPPAAFVLIPLGVLHGIAGAVLLVAATWGVERASEAGRLFCEQGVFLCFAIGVGSLFYPLIGGAPPPPDFDASPAERLRMVGFAAAGIGILLTLMLEVAGWERVGPLMRAAIVGGAVALGVGAARLPGRPGINRRFIWLAMWCMPLGLAVSGALPDYRVPALHVLFVGGFSLMALAVGAHVVLGHAGREDLRDGNPWPVVTVGALVVVAMLGRVVADWSETYFAHVASAAATWLAASALWLAYLGPKLRREGA